MSVPEKIVVSYNASDMRTTEANILSQIDTEIHPKNDILTWIFSQSIFTLSRHPQLQNNPAGQTRTWLKPINI